MLNIYRVEETGSQYPNYLSLKCPCCSVLVQITEPQKKISTKLPQLKLQAPGPTGFVSIALDLYQ